MLLVEEVSILMFMAKAYQKKPKKMTILIYLKYGPLIFMVIERANSKYKLSVKYLHWWKILLVKV